MTSLAAALVGLFLLVLLACVTPLGLYMANVFDGRPIWPLRALGECERGIYRLCGIDPAAEMSWKQYALALLLLNALGALALYALQRGQAWLPLNPQKFAGVPPDSSFNTAVSFITNTNWQGYSGESAMSYFTQMAALTVQNFLSAATGMATLVAFARGFSRRSVETLGNFWVDMTRGTLYILLPLSLVFAVVLVSQGMPQTFSAYPTV